MRRVLTALCVAMMAAAPVSVAVAEEAPAAAAAAPKYSTDETDIGTLLDTPELKAILLRFFPDVANSDQLDMARPMTLRAIQPYAAEVITDEKLAEMDAELAKVQ